MYFLSCRHFEKKEGREDEHEKEHAVFDRALNEAIRVQDRQKLRAEERFRHGLGRKSLVAGLARPMLGIIAAVIGNFPLRIESVRTHRTVHLPKIAPQT